LIRIGRRRLPTFTLAGGCFGMLGGILLVATWLIMRRQIRVPEFSEMIDYLIFTTIPFAYGAASGAFTAMAMGSLDRKYMDRTPK
jgi:cytosine/uracil/thiamine/allantoin permease